MENSGIYRFQLVPHAFGGSYPTQDVGPGTVALFTGEYQIVETDVSVPGYGGELTLGRTHGTLTGDPSGGPAGVFGPGWTADIAGQGAGVAGYTVTDHTGVDGTFVLTSPEGESSIYANDTGTRADLKLGGYDGVGETALLADTLTLAAIENDPVITHSLTLTELDGTITEFQRTTTGVWSVARTTEPEANSTVRFIRNPDGLIEWVLAPSPAGVTCSETSLVAGCRALKLGYTTATPKRLTQVQYVGWDPKPGADGLQSSNAAMATVDVARYGYDTQGRLVETWTPESAGDTGTGRKTSYSYTTINSKTVVDTFTDPGQQPWRFSYANQALATVKRPLDPAVGSGDATWTLRYDVPLSGSTRPDLQATDVAAWGMSATDAPVGATAVFEPDHVPDGTTTPTTADGDWPYATLSYFTAAGRTTNTAVYGAGDWLVDSTRYDANGNTIWTLSAEGRAAAIAEGHNNEAATLAAAHKYAAWTFYNDAGTRVESSYSPARPVVLADGTTMLGRTFTETDYDDEPSAAPKDGRPTSGIPDGGFMLAVEQRTGVTDTATPARTTPATLLDKKTVRYRYDPVVAGDASGWDLRVPTRTLTQDGNGWATTLTRYDTEGKVIETRTPAGTAITDGTANDVYSTKTTYYTAGPNPAGAAWGDKPAWTGSVCRVATAGNPTSGHPVPTTTTTGYSLRGSTTRVEETSGNQTRATVTTRDYLDRETSSSVSLAGHDTIASTTSYDPTTGAVTATTSNGMTEEFTYDTWARTRTTTDGNGNTATTTYDTAGRTATSHDGKGTYTYTYDSPSEHRGLTTAIDLGYASGDTDQITGSYDTAGNLIHQTMPGGWQMDWTRNLAGQPTSLAYTKDGVPEMGMAFTQTYDHLGRVRTATSPAGARSYRYDDRARLIEVRDHHAMTGCTTRQYTFTGDSNRTKLTSYGPDGDGACQTTTEAGEPESYSYDQADRIIGEGYSYDPTGRTLTMPAKHTNQADVVGAGDLQLGYHANDMVATLEQTVPDGTGGTVDKLQTFSLDASDRISTIVTRTDGIALTETVNHFDGDSDSPAWTLTTRRPDETSEFSESWNRYLSDLTGGLAIDIDQDGVAFLQLTNMHGNIVTTATLGQAGIGSYTEPDEYGCTPRGAPTSRYGWLGAHQRDADTLGGLTLMGARLYAPATGRFLSIDPIPGGNDNRYTYPGDPINQLDLSGEIAFVIPLIIGGALIAGLLIYANTPAYRRNATFSGASFKRWFQDRWGGVVTIHSRVTRQAIAAAIGIVYAAKKTTKKSDKEAATDVPRYARGEKIRANETADEAMKRIMDHRYPKTAKEKRRSSDYKKIWKYLHRRR